MAGVRLQKFLAECGVGSRRKMEQFITEGRVRVNQQVVTDLGRRIDPETDKVEVNRKPVHAAPKGILLLNKPRGVVSTLSDPEGRRSVADFLTKRYASYFPVGRLDWDSTGLMVLTNDGEVAERLMHPRYGFERVYHARVEGAVGDVVLGKVARGVRLSDGVVKAKASVVSNDENTTWIEVSLAEGRNRVVRRLFEKVGHPVIKLKRIVYGPFKLGRLQVGQVRALTEKEYEQARRKVLTFKPHEAEAEVESAARVAALPERDRVIPSGERRDRRDRPERRERSDRGRGFKRDGEREGGYRERPRRGGSSDSEARFERRTERRPSRSTESRPEKPFGGNRARFRRNTKGGQGGLRSGLRGGQRSGQRGNSGAGARKRSDKRR
jgi:23S rRNA pseudouridine2605 synthase